MHRRSELLALAALVLVASAVPGCAPVRGPSRAQERLQIIPAGGDVYAFQLIVSAALRGSQPPRSCAFRLADSLVPAALEPAGASARLSLRAGENLVSATCTWPGGRTLQSEPVRYTVRLPDVPRAEAHVHVGQASLVLDGTRSTSSEGSGAPLVEYAWFRRDEASDAAPALALGRAAQLELPLPGPQAEGELVFELQVHDARGQVGTARTILVAGPGAAHEKDPREGPRWLDGAVVYGVIPPLFGSPPFAALVASLDRLQALGVLALWLSPIFTSAPGDYGYAVTDPFRVRPDYGDAQALRRLVAEAHARGLRVLLDLVPNHTSELHPYFLQTKQLGSISRYFDFYDRDAAGQVTHYFDWKHLPNLNYENPEVARFTLAAGLYWLTGFDIDGYRVDAAWGIKQRRADFWPMFTAEFKRVQPDGFLLAEASARDPYYLRHGFDAAYDWTEELGHHAWEHVFDSEAGIAARLHAALTAEAGGRADRVFRFLNNNDTGARFITKHGEPLTRVATAALLTLPGIPCLYTFDEIGAEYQPYEENTPLQPKNEALRNFHRRLIALRRDEPALHGPQLHALHVGDAADDVYVYLRSGGQRQVIVALNFSGQQRSVSVRLPVAVRSFRDALAPDAGAGAPSRTRRVLMKGPVLTLDLEPWASLVLVPESSPSGRN
jgi:glycosidase